MPPSSYRWHKFRRCVSKVIKLCIGRSLVLDFQHLCKCSLRINTSRTRHIRDVLDFYISPTHHNTLNPPKIRNSPTSAETTTTYLST
jgi:hypothetical protein